MKIIFSTYLPISLISGGPRVQVLQTAKELNKLKVTVKFFDQWAKNDFMKVDLVHLFAANIGTYHIAKILHQQKIPFVISPIVYSQRSNPLIRTATNLTYLIKKIKPGFYTDFQITKDICDWSKIVLPNTSDELDLINNGLSIDKMKLILIPNGVEDKFLKGSKTFFKKKFNLNNFLLNVGHIGPERKNIYRLINALKRTTHKLVIIGKISKDSSGDKCLKIANENPNILLIDGIDHDSPLLSSAYSSCSAFLLPSLFETPGIAALEAGLAGAPIVITEKGGTKDYFQNFAQYVNPYSKQSILNGIENSLREKKTDSLQKHIRNNFLWSSVAEKTLKAYKQALKY